MSWFKKKERSESQNSIRSSDASINGEGMIEKRHRCDTDPETCLKVFQNHWEQAYKIICSDTGNDNSLVEDEKNTVSHNFEQMVTLLVEEKGEHGQGMPGPILHYLLEHDILDKFCSWCQRYNEETGKFLSEQLRMFDHLIAHSNQLLLIHKPIIKPLLNLLANCARDEISAQIESNLVLLLHQLCVSISKETVILESVFNTSADHGPTKFLIFSLLIKFLHREGQVGQQARDALLLIMTLSARHPYIGQYIAQNSDFCPVLATGLSGLYSDLPRKITIPSEDWCQMTDDDVQNNPEMAMFLNSLEFCNAIAQIAHPLVRDQLIKFIYNGFLVPVLGPALHQNSREEVITATAYLDLFLRKISEPCLVKAFLKFIFTEKNDEMAILESLITRISSSSKLCLVSLSLFYTLVDLNCEDVMFDLVFKYLIPCTHVMVSQRRSVKDQDVYCRSAEKFLSLKPTCCLPEIDSPMHNIDGLPDLTAPTNNSNQPGITKSRLFRSSKKEKKRDQKMSSDSKVDSIKIAYPPGSFGSKLEHFETSFLEYIQDAHMRVQKCSQACHSWLYPYDGENPPPASLNIDIVDSSNIQMNSAMEIASEQKQCNDSTDGFLKATAQSQNDKSVGFLGKMSKYCDTSVCNSDTTVFASAIEKTDISRLLNTASSKLIIASEEDFIAMLENFNSPVEKSATVEESLKSLEMLLSSVSVSISWTSTPRKESIQNSISEVPESFAKFNDKSEFSTVYYECESSGGSEIFKSIDEMPSEISDSPAKSTSASEFEITEVQEMSINVNNNSKSTSFENISLSPLNEVQKGTKDKLLDNFINVEAVTSVSAHKVQDNTSGKNVTLNTASSISVSKSDNNIEQHKFSKGDKSVRFEELPAKFSIGVGLNPLYRQRSSPNTGPFLMALLLKLEGMMQNPLSVNLALTGLISRLAVYHQPLIRSFLLNHNLVFQPTIKSLVQVLTSVRQKVDHFSYTVPNFEALLLRARRTLAQREGLLSEQDHSITLSPEITRSKMRSTIADLPSKEKRHRTLKDLFRRSPVDRRGINHGGDKSAHVEILTGNKGIKYINNEQDIPEAVQVESIKMRNAVYCAIVLEEFVKELASITQEHAVLMDAEEIDR